MHSLLSRSGRSTSPRHNGVRLVEAIAVAALVFFGCGACGSETSGPPNNTTAAPSGGDYLSLGAGQKWDQPCPGANLVSTVANLAKSVQAYLPASATATKIWTCGEKSFAQYNDIQLSYTPGWKQVENVAKKWEDMARQDGGHVETISGYPAYIHPGIDETADGTPVSLPEDERYSRNAVYIVVGDTLILAMADHTVPLEKVVALAKTIPLPKPA